ncbi:hypothetical protein EDD59_1505 [Muricomes intestini]|uniref:Uncharacterized protein n=1 Tax=Muricomes intestini TaxID=1796634 RepID=A0A4R3JYP9_9FIRM|nr:hypothetical protein [Muricomes intestini]TCS72776.1 hypothetical protein EDD59_1505 [Muricomes intestini]
MMKKLLVCAAVAGVAVGVYNLLCKAKKEENISSKPMEEKTDSEPEIKDETTVEEQDAVREMYVAKEKSTQSVRERHTEAAGIMADAFANIMKDVEPVELDEESVETVVDTKDVEIINELDSLSDELDELLK